MAQPLSPHLALRIGLAARALPNVTPKYLVGLLIDVLKLPLTDSKLKALTIYQLRTARNGPLKSVPRQVLSTACAYLRDKATVDIIDTSLPDIVAYEKGDMQGSIRLALATDQGLNVNAHFGTCLRFLIYQISACETRLVDVRGTAGAKSAKDPQAWRAELVNDCHLVLVESIGLSDVARLMKDGIYPVKYPETRLASEALADIQKILSDAPPPWLGKLMGHHELERRRLPQLLAVPNKQLSF